ncbi:MAG: AAA family ATPase [Pseudomonadota bacterium]|nr:AAA family ATPase [Pseudomonadota bacterium]
MVTKADSFGLRLRRLRKSLDLTQEQLADLVSCSRYTIRKIEADERRPSRHLLQRLIQELAVPDGERERFRAAGRGLPQDPSLPGLQRLSTSTLRAPAPPQAAFAGATFVDRNGELARLQTLLAEAAESRGHVVLIEGEPGIGKSRLLAESVLRAQAAGACIVASRCYEIERSVPYQPVIELAAQAVERLQGVGDASIGLADIAEIAALLPEIGPGPAATAMSSDVPEARQARLFRALLHLLEAAAADTALVLIVDDLQWADEISAQFLHWLARQASGHALLLLYSVRDESLGVDERLAALVHSLRREPHAVHLPLARLDLAATQALLGVAVDAALAARLHRETEGNPFFLVSLMQKLDEGCTVGVEGDALPLPQALRAALRERLAQVPAEARVTLDAAAVLGRHVELHRLASVTGEDERKVLSALEALVARRLLLEDSEGCFDFTHDKLREVAYLEIGATRRVMIHRAVANTLEHAGVQGAELAEHCERGRLWPQALDNMLRAGEQSSKWFAMRDALHWFDRAIELVQMHPEAAPLGPPVGLYARRGAARAHAGQLEGAEADLRRVIVDARGRNDTAALRDALIDLGMAYRRADRYADAMTALEEALRACRAMGDERRAADTLYHLGTVAWSNGCNRDAIACHEQAVQISVRLELADLVAVQAWHGRGEAHFNHLEPGPAVDCYERSILLARKIGDKSYECENEMMIGYACTGYVGLADYARAELAFESSLAIARQADLQWHMSPTLLGLYHVRACMGRYGEAWTGLVRTLEGLRSAGHVRYELIARDLMGCLLVDLGRHDHAVELLEGAQRLARDKDLRFWRPRIAANLAIAQARRGQYDVTALDAALQDASDSGEAMHAARCREALAEVALRRGDARACLHHADQLLAEADLGGLLELSASGRRWRGEAFIAQGHRRKAVDELLQAHGEARRLGRVRLMLDTASALGRLGRAEAACALPLAQTIRDSLCDSELDAAELGLQTCL